MKSIKSKVIATLFALCFALLGYSCQCEAQAQPVKPGELVTKNAIVFYSESPFTLKTYNTSKNWKKADNSDGYIGYCSTNSANDSDWQEWDGTEIPAVLNSGKYYIFLRGKGNAIITGDSNGCRFVIESGDENAKVTLDGNMMNLLDYNTDYTKPGNLKIPGNYCFAHLFYQCTNLETLGPDFSLPATTLADYCYYNMFSGCTSLKTAPALPATTLTDYCYQSMFYNCTSLTSAPALPAETLADWCYSRMFYGCTSLTSAPALPATTLADYCYSSMFEGCTDLKFSSTQVGEYTNEFKLGDATNKTDALRDMFKNTGGTFTSTPTGTMYYTSNTVIPAN